MTTDDDALARCDPSTPRVSVVIPCYRAAGFVAEAVSSVLAQGEEGIEIIVVDDGSPEGETPVDALRPFGGAVTLLAGPHGGAAVARNRGIDAARGRYLAFLDADDLWKPGFLRRQIALLEREGADLVYCDAELFGTRAGRGRTVMHSHPSRGRVTAAAVLSGECVVVMSTVLVRADRVRAVGGFDADLPLCEDVDLWVRLLLSGCRVVYHRQALSLRRMHDANISRDGDGMLRGTLEVIARHEGRANLDPGERDRVDRRIRDIHAERRVLAAKRAILDGRAEDARRELWETFRRTRGWKPLVAALSLAVAPGPTLRFLRKRQEPWDLVSPS